jgi:hypothetical protein
MNFGRIGWPVPREKRAAAVVVSILTEFQPHLGWPDGRKQSQVLEKSGERGRNRTFNLLIVQFDQTTNDFRFPNFLTGRQNGTFTSGCYEECYVRQLEVANMFRHPFKLLSDFPARFV